MIEPILAQEPFKGDMSAKIWKACAGAIAANG
jgi:hypothetical protein